MSRDVIESRRVPETGDSAGESVRCGESVWERITCLARPEVVGTHNHASRYPSSGFRSFNLAEVLDLFVSEEAIDIFEMFLHAFIAELKYLGCQAVEEVTVV